MSIYHPQNINELVDNAMLELGHPVITINVAEEQAIKAAMVAIDLYVDYHYDGTEHVFIAQNITQDDIDNNYISTPQRVRNVTRVFPTQGFPSLYGNGTCCFDASGLGGLYSGAGGPFMRSASYDRQGLVGLYLASAHRSYFKSILNPNIPIDWNRTSKRIRFLGDIKQATSRCGKTIIYEAHIVNENLRFDCDQPESEGSCFYDNEWLKSMTAAQIRKIWGNNLSKFTNISIASGFEFNGDKILDEAKADIERLTIELFDRYTLPAQMIIG